MSHPREDPVGYSSIPPTTTNNTSDDVDRIVESPPSPDVGRPFFEPLSQRQRTDSGSFEEPRPLQRTETNHPAPPTSIGITRTNTLQKYGRHSTQWLFKGFSVRRDIFRMKLDEDQ